MAQKKYLSNESLKRLNRRYSFISKIPLNKTHIGKIMEQQVLSLPVAVGNVLGWSTKTNIIGSGFVDGQYIKITEEVGELAGKIARKDVPEIKDAVGDIQVILINLIAMLGRDPVKTFEYALYIAQRHGIEALKERNTARLLANILNNLTEFVDYMDDDGKALPDKPYTKFFDDLIVGVYTSLKEIGRRYGFTPEEALTDAWNVIKDREGIFYNRVFIKSADFTRPMLEDMLASNELPAASIEMANRYLAKL